MRKHHVLLSDITDVYLEPSAHASNSFRLYRGIEVLQLTPVGVPLSSDGAMLGVHSAACWADAIYAAMELQTVVSDEVGTVRTWQGGKERGREGGKGEGQYVRGEREGGRDRNNLL